MMWHEGDKKKTPTKIMSEAIEYFKNKYGVTPRSCEVNPGFITREVEAELLSSFKDLRIIPIKHVHPNLFTFWPER